jgi:5-hydroxyisourate hydrolase-like protein (transthyretin family)
LFVLICELCTIARPGACQTERRLELHVIDSLSGAPVDNAEIRVIKTIKDSAGWMIRRSTDTTGRALIAVPNNERLLMLVRRLGYASSLLQVEAATQNDAFFVALAPTALALGTTVTTATALSRRLTATGFYERQRIKPGIFLDSAAIAARKPLDIIAVVGPYIKNACTVAYLDGLPLVDIRDIDVKRVVGVEFYASNLEAPAEFRNPLDSEHRCATVLIWRQSP